MNTAPFKRTKPPANNIRTALAILTSFLCGVALTSELYLLLSGNSNPCPSLWGPAPPKAAGNIAGDETDEKSELKGDASVKKTDKSSEITRKLIVPDRCDTPTRGHFDKIYSGAIWGAKLRNVSDFYSEAAWPQKDSRKNSASGPGSNLGHSTETSLKIVKKAIAKYHVKSMIDIPCGDANWIFDSFVTDSLPLYLGLDVTSAVIEVNKQRYAHHINKIFEFWDATTCTLPKFQMGLDGMPTSFDLVHVRDVIQHMTLAQGVNFFCNVFNSGARVLITTTYPHSTNKNITEGDFYLNNLSLEPFSFPDGFCEPTHPQTDSDVTCVYDLTESWVNVFASTKCKHD